MVNNPPAMQETRVQALSWEDPLEKGPANHSSILAWRIHGQRNRAGYNPWGHKESDTTELLTHHDYLPRNGLSRNPPNQTVSQTFRLSDSTLMPHLELGPTYQETSYLVLSPLPATSMGPTSQIQAFILSLLGHGHQPPHHLPAALRLFHPPLGRKMDPQGAELGPCHSPAQQPSVTHYCLCHLPSLDDHQCSKFHHCLVA